MVAVSGSHTCSSEWLQPASWGAVREDLGAHVCTCICKKELAKGATLLTYMHTHEHQRQHLPHEPHTQYIRVYVHVCVGVLEVESPFKGL